MSDKPAGAIVAAVSLEQAEQLARILHSTALQQPADKDYTVRDLVVQAGLSSQYDTFNRTDCQRVAKAFRRLSIECGKQAEPPFVRALGYNKQTKMCYTTVESVFPCSKV